MPFESADQVVAQAVSWLWENRIPLGKLLILDGDPDLGKSLVVLDLCARLSTGRPFPDGRPGSGPANALVLSAEDTPSDTIVPRLHRLGADLGRVFVWERERDDEDWPWRFPTHANRLDDALKRTDARLAIIDPIMGFLDNTVLSGSDQSVRRALAPLMHLAEKHRCAVLLQRHLNKQGGGRALYRGLGSIAFVAACRFALLVGRDPDESGRCVLAQVRNSLAGSQPSLVYRLATEGGGLPTVDWLGTSPLAADDLLRDGENVIRPGSRR
ncbi:MAG: AAA family ATPase [Solirubrobacterales bacterium]|nr:AAA family ATPase [Solirubrobacterales bacterium]